VGKLGVEVGQVGRRQVGANGDTGSFEAGQPQDPHTWPHLTTGWIIVPAKSDFIGNAKVNSLRVHFMKKPLERPSGFSVSFFWFFHLI
jgi:hypothetical protein